MLCQYEISFILKKKKKKKYHTVGTAPKSNIKIVEKGKIDIPQHAYIQNRPTTLLGTGTSNKSGGA